MFENGFHYRRSLSAGTALASGQQDVGHEGVATRRRVLSLPSFIQFARCGVFGLVLFPQESQPYVTAIRVRSLKTNAYGIYSLNSRILFNKLDYGIDSDRSFSNELKTFFYSPI